MYFGNIFTLAHQTFEEFIESAGLSWAKWFEQNTHLVPIRHAESDFILPFRAGQTYSIQTSVARLSESTFVMRYDFWQGQNHHARVKMAHTYVDKTTMQKTPIPSNIRQLLLPYLKEQQ